MLAENQDLSITLSHEELRYLLFLLKSGPIAGMDTELDEEYLGRKQILALSLAHGERSLRARGWAKINDEGNITIKETILLMVGVCAFPEFLLSVHVFPSSSNPKRMYWNGQNGVIVAHERPEAPLHRFSFVKNRDDLFQQFLKMSNVQSLEKFFTEGFTTTLPIFKDVRKVLKKSSSDAIKLLENNGASTTLAQELVHILADEHTVAVVHSLVAKGEGKEPKKSSGTVLSGKTCTWLSTTGEDNTVTMKPIGKDEIQGLFAGWTAPAEDWIRVSQA